MSAMPLPAPIFKLARSRSLPFVPIRPLAAPTCGASTRLDAHAPADRRATTPARKASS